MEPQCVRVAEALGEKALDCQVELLGQIFLQVRKSHTSFRGSFAGYIRASLPPPPHFLLLASLNMPNNRSKKQSRIPENIAGIQKSKEQDDKSKYKGGLHSLV